ncbi:MAG: hypothetical protein GKC04_03870 [Methanomicrobiales archaeon]|nr:hypothetical protein [Methanomicrobiales archaeon]
MPSRENSFVVECCPAVSGREAATALPVPGRSIGNHRMVVQVQVMQNGVAACRRRA